MPRGIRGRKVKKNPPGRPPSKDIAATKIKLLSLPTAARDDEPVECSTCGKSSTFREFRIHNIEEHYNLAKTQDDAVLLDHKYFVRKLQELGKLVKITTFFCPYPECESTYKSALGLAYHLETCGKTAEEIAACLIECEICNKKFTLPNLNWHRKHQHPQPEPQDPLTDIPPDDICLGAKRKSAIKAREFMKEITDFTIKTEAEDDDYQPKPSCQLDRDIVDGDFALTAYHIKRKTEEEDDEEDEAENLEVTPIIILNADEVQLSSKRRLAGIGNKPDFSAQASKYLEAHADPWDTPIRVIHDPLPDAMQKVNSLQPIESDDEIRQYLPTLKASVRFAAPKPQSQEDEGLKRVEFHRLKRFDGEIISDDEDFVSFAGGSISGIAWHPSGNFLAISTLKDISESPNLVEIRSHPSCVQIYCQTINSLLTSVFSIELIIGLDFGYVNHLKWSMFWPSSANIDSDVIDIDADDKCMGYLGAACEDSTCRIFALTRSDFDLPPTLSTQCDSEKNLRVYRKLPEIILRIDEDSLISTGQCTHFDWDDTSRYVGIGYVSGHIAIFDLYSTSNLLRTQVTDDQGNSFTYFNPIWLIKGHLSPVTAIIVDPKVPRYFYTGSMDRTLRTWDVELRLEVECKKVGCVIDMCWVRGWIHLGVCVDAAVSNPGSQYNFLRYYAVGNSHGRPNTVEYFNIISTSFFEGITLCGSENGRVNISYYDAFWRECDYERNKKKRNVVNIVRLGIDMTGFEPLRYAKKETDIAMFPATEEPQITFIISRQRTQGSQEHEPTNQDVENIYRFYKFIRVNKVSWSPGGKFITIGYRNGLFAIIPADFDKLFS